jgi:hypothetical protein
MNDTRAEAAARAPSSSVRQRRVERSTEVRRLDERTLETESAWSLLRETFECRDFDDSLVFVE